MQWFVIEEMNDYVGGQNWALNWPLVIPFFIFSGPYPYTYRKLYNYADRVWHSLCEAQK